MVFFPLNTEYFTSLCLHCSWREVSCNSYLFSFVGKAVCLVGSLRVFSVIFDVLHFQYDVPMFVCLFACFWPLSFLVFPELLGSVIWFLTLIWLFLQNYLCCFLFLLLLPLPTVFIPFIVVLWFLDIVLCFLVVFSLHFLKFLVSYPQALRCFS